MWETPRSQISTCNSKCLPLWLSNRGSCYKSVFTFFPSSILISIARLLWSAVTAFSSMITYVFGVSSKPARSEFKWWHNLYFKSGRPKVSSRENPPGLSLCNSATERNLGLFIWHAKDKTFVKIELQDLWEVINDFAMGNLPLKTPNIRSLVIAEDLCVRDPGKVCLQGREILFP